MRVDAVREKMEDSDSEGDEEAGTVRAWIIAKTQPEAGGVCLLASLEDGEERGKGAVIRPVPVSKSDFLLRKE